MGGQVDEQLKRIVNADGVPEFVIVDKHGKILKRYGLTAAADADAPTSKSSSSVVVQELKVKAHDAMYENDRKSLQIDLDSSPKKRRIRRRSQRKVTTGRVTVEILDDASSVAPSTARSNISVHDTAATQAQESAADKIDEFSFDYEQSRVALSQDSFVPSLEPQKSNLEKQSRELERERARLHKLQDQVQAVATQQRKSLANRRQRREEVEHELAATKIQAKMRQRKATMIVDQEREKNREARERAQHWIMVRNEADEVWYHNTQTRESQWHPPPELASAAQSNDSRFPVLPSSAASSEFLEYPESNISVSSQSSTRRHSSLPPLSPDGGGDDGNLRYCVTPADAADTELPGIGMRNTTTPGVVNEWNFHREEHAEDDAAALETDEDDGRVNAFESNLFLADGSKSGLFKKTIREQLRTSRFHSITQLIASQVRPEKSSKAAGGSDSGIGRKVVLGKKKSGQRYMVSKLSSTKKGAKKKSTAAKANKSNRAGGEIPRVRDVEDPGFTAAAMNQETAPHQQPRNKKDAAKCLGCFIKGKSCSAHAPKGTHMVKESDSVLLCDNWDVGELRRKYRAEELQEVFQIKNPSLRYNKTRKQWISMAECRHPIYRYVAHHRLAMNRTVRRRLHVRVWFQSFLDILRTDRKSDKVNASQGMSLMRIRTTMRNFKWCRGYSESVEEYRPKPPVTKERLKAYDADNDDPLEQIYVDISKRPRVKVLPTEPPPTIELYRPRKYVPGPRQFIPMPEPSFSDATPIPVRNRFIDGSSNVSWFERLVARTSLMAINKAHSQITACVPSTGANIVLKTSHPKTTTVKFAAFDRKTTPENKAVGGLSAELTIHMIVTTYVPPQFGDFRVTNYAAVNPGVTRDFSASYRCLKTPMILPAYIFRALEHTLNVRRAPCVTISTCAPIDAPHYHGLNRPEQTGEEEPYGFKTTEYHKGLSLLGKTIAHTFTPTAEAMTPNLTETNQTTTTRADRHYPFCEPSTKANTVSEFIHLLWVGKSSRNQGQCFTNLGRQDAGDFMRNSDPEQELGTYNSIVYRSWAYMQYSPYEEFVTDNGIAYWYDRDTGKTFWERPILEMEKKRGGDGDVDGTVTDGAGEKASLGVGMREPRYTQKEMRAYITKSIEEPKDEEIRKKKVMQSAKRHDIQLPDKATTEAPASSKFVMPKLKINKKPIVAESTEKPPTQASNSSRGALSSVPESTSVVHPSPPVPINDHVLQSITAAIGNVLGTDSSSVSASNMLQLGIGLGMGLGMQSTGSTPAAASRPSTSATVPRPSTAASSTGSDDMSSVGLSTDRSSASGGRPDSAASRVTSAETGVTATPTPDEMPPSAAETTPVVDEDEVDFYTHDAAGKGTSWVALEDRKNGFDHAAVPGSNGVLHKSVARLPEGFVDSISTTRCVPMQADYLPRMTNINEARCVGVVKPRRVADEWVPVGYDPWSAGKEMFGTEFITNLSLEEEEPVSVSTTGGAAFKEAEGHEARQQLVTGAAKDAQDLETLMSLCRHGKYEEIEEKLNSPDWTLPIDAKDSKGNTLLSIACQNDKRRILKLCLRKGADINTQNINGQTPLHFCHAYHFTSLADYLMEKGADDTIVNADNLTCYEGLNLDEVDNI